MISFLLKRSVKNIKLFLSDVDGVLTDGGMYYSEKGDELKKFNTRDGMAFKLLREHGIKTGVVTSEQTQMVANRAKKLKLDYCKQGQYGQGKLGAAKEICDELGISLEQTAYVGDDINCLDLLSNVGFAFCPKDAQISVKKVKNITVVNCNGGAGLIRKITDMMFYFKEYDMSKQDYLGTFDNIYKNVINQKYFYLYGAGLFGKSFYEKFKDKLTIKAFLDGDEKKHGCIVDGLKVCSFEDVKEECKTGNFKIIIASYFYHEIKALLIKNGLVENVDFFDSEVITSLYYMYNQEKLVLHRTDISVTYRCSLNCEKCNMWTPYYKKPVDKTLEELKADVDAYFSWCDLVERMYILGGEVFLYKQLDEFLIYLMENYSKKIERLEIFTNATILPSEKIIDLCKKYSIAFFVSDYSPGLPHLSKNVSEIKSVLDEAGIDYAVDKYDKWLDFGSPFVKSSRTDEENRQHFHDCHMIWHGLQNKKLYFCHSDCSAKRAGILPENINDFFDLSQKPVSIEDKKLLMEFDLCVTPRGFLELCQYCNGSYAVNKNFTDVAKQIKRSFN